MSSYRYDDILQKHLYASAKTAGVGGLVGRAKNFIAGPGGTAGGAVISGVTGMPIGKFGVPLSASSRALENARRPGGRVLFTE